MTSHDFFTRMIALNAVGPNLQESPGAKEVCELYICSVCDAVHNYRREAENCCPVEVHARYQCPTCEEQWGERDEAVTCCTNASQSPSPMQCPVCMEGAESFAIAADCCLHTHPTMTAAGRERVAKEVEGGSTWLEAISANAFH